MQLIGAKFVPPGKVAEHGKLGGHFLQVVEQATWGWGVGDFFENTHTPHMGKVGGKPRACRGLQTFLGIQWLPLFAFQFILVIILGFHLLLPRPPTHSGL